MNQRTVLGILLVFVVITFTQCTVQKRLYRKGYYISFNKTPKRTTETQEEKPLTVFSSADSTKAGILFTPEESEMSSVEPPELKKPFSNSVVDETTTSFGVKTVLNRAKENAKSLIKQVVSKGEKDPEPVAKKQPRHVRTAILVSMILLFGIGVAVIYLGIVAWNPFVVISGVLITVGSIIGLFIGLAVEDSIANKEKVEEEKKVQRENEQKLSEEEWTDLKQKQYRKAVRTTILLIVLFFAISLFAIAVGEPMPLIVITGAMFLIFLAFVWGTYKTKRKDDPAVSTEG